MIYLLKILFSSIEYSAMLMLSLSLFRIPFKYHLPKILLIALIESIISFYFRDTYNGLEVIPTVISQIIMIMVAFNLVIYYSILLCIIGFLAGSLIETVVMLTGIQLGLTTPTLIQQTVLHLNIVQFTAAILMLLLVYFLQSKKIGFMFIARHLSIKQALKGYNFVLSIFLLLSIIVLQITLVSYNESKLSIYVAVILVLVLTISLWTAFKHNVKILKQKDERLSKR